MVTATVLLGLPHLIKLSLTSKALVHGTLDFFKDAGIEKLNIDELYNCEEYYLEKGYMFKEIETIEDIIEKDEGIKVKEGNIFWGWYDEKNDIGINKEVLSFENKEE